MKRLLTTVAFSALVLGVAAPLTHAADPAPTTPGMSASQSTQGSAVPAQSGLTEGVVKKDVPSSTTAATQPPAKPAVSSSATPSPDKITTASTTVAAAPKKHAMRRGSHKDHMADELNRQELAQITGSGASSYGSSR